MSKKVTIDNKEYELEGLSDDTKAHIASIQAVDRRIKDLQEQLAIMQTAKMGYTNALKDLIEKETPVPAN